MPSSPADSASGLLGSLIERWDHAFEALQRDDVQRAEVLIAQADDLLARLVDMPEGDDGALRQRAAQSHGRVLAAAQAMQRDTDAALGRVHQGRRALAGYRPTAPR